MTVRQLISFIRGFEHLSIGEGSKAIAEYTYKSDTLHASAAAGNIWEKQVLYINQLADPDWLWVEVRDA